MNEREGGEFCKREIEKFFKRKADAMSETCWKNRFHPSVPRCKNKGVWMTDPKRAANNFDRAVRWCDAHKQRGDVLDLNVVYWGFSGNGMIP